MRIAANVFFWVQCGF